MFQSTIAAFLSFALLGNPTDPAPAEKAAPVAFTGVVFDQGNVESLAGATIRIEELDLEVITDFDGNFTFQNVPPGIYTLHVSLVSYIEKNVEGVQISGNAVSRKFFIGSL